jgi:uncharacterized protein (DUF697 family)
MAGLSPFTVWGLLKELRTAAEDSRPLVVGGPLAAQLAKELARGGDPSAIRVDGRPEEGAVLVRVLAGAPTEEDEQLLRAAHRAGVPVVAVQTGGEFFDVPYVLATDVVVCPPGSGFPIDEIAAVIAGRLGERATSLSARLPVLRNAVADALIERFSQRNAVIGAAVFVPGADFAVLTLNQLRLVLRLGAAYGVDVDQQRAPEILVTIGAGLGFRALARRLLRTLPVGGFIVKGGVAYAGTRALGEAAQRYFQAVSERAVAA